MTLPIFPGQKKDPEGEHEDELQDDFSAPSEEGFTPAFAAPGAALTPSGGDDWDGTGVTFVTNPPAGEAGASPANTTPTAPGFASVEPSAASQAAPATDDPDAWGNAPHHDDGAVLREDAAMSVIPIPAASTQGEAVQKALSKKFDVGPAGGEAVDAYVPPQYITVGSLTSEQLINAKSDQFAPLADKIQRVVEWVQNRITDEDRTEDAIAARREGGAKYDKMARDLDRMILEFMNSQRDMPRGEDRKVLIAAAVNEILGLGPLEPLWHDPRITEIMVNGPYDVQVEIGGKIIRVPGARFRNAEHLTELCQQILATIGRRVDIQRPIEDGRLHDGSRVHVVHNAIAPSGPNLTIRRHREDAWTVKELVARGAMSDEMVKDLGFWINSGCSAIVIGSTGSGKTTVLNAISGFIPLDQRIVTIEDSLELKIHPKRLVAAPMEARPESASGRGGVSIRDLVKASLRMRPDWIVVGEVRDASAFDMLTALNTGHSGLTTVHANGAVEAVPRLESLVAQAGELDPKGILGLISGSIDLFVVVDRFPEDGSRRMTGIYEVPARVEMDESGRPSLEPVPLWEFVHDSTDPVTGKVEGHYEKRSDPSEVMVRKHRLNRRKPMSLEEIYELST